MCLHLEVVRSTSEVTCCSDRTASTQAGSGSRSFGVFALLCAGWLPLAPGARQTALYAASVLAAFSANGTVPLYFELAVEAAFPVAEGLVATILTASTSTRNPLQKCAMNFRRRTK